MRILVLAGAVLLLAACHDRAPGGVTPSESQALNDAAEMQDANSVSANAVAADPNAGNAR